MPVVPTSTTEPPWRDPARTVRRARWRDLSPSLGYGSGSLAWRRLRIWYNTGTRDHLRRLVLGRTVRRRRAELIQGVNRRAVAAREQGGGPDGLHPQRPGQLRLRVPPAVRRERLAAAWLITGTNTCYGNHQVTMTPPARLTPGTVVRLKPTQSEAAVATRERASTCGRQPPRSRPRRAVRAGQR